MMTSSNRQFEEQLVTAGSTRKSAEPQRPGARRPTEQVLCGWESHSPRSEKVPPQPQVPLPASPARHSSRSSPQAEAREPRPFRQELAESVLPAGALTQAQLSV